MSRVQWEGSCHCRAVAYRVLLDAQPTSYRCNCSICTKARTWFVPVAVADFTILRGEEALSTYTFGAGSIEHRFCTVCGVRTHGHGEAEELGGRYVSISVATLDLSPEQFAAIEVTYLNGRDDKFDEPPPVTSYL